MIFFISRPCSSRASVTVGVVVPGTVRALFMGPSLVLTAVSDTWTSSLWEEPPIGVPVSEAWIEEAWRPVQRLMAEVYRVGVAHSIRIPGGDMVIAPYLEHGEVVGVTTRIAAVHPTPGPRPASPASAPVLTR